MKCSQTSECSNMYRAWDIYSTGTFLTFSPQSLYSGSLLRASLWTRLAVMGKDPSMWSAIQEDSLCTSMSEHASMGHTANTTTNNSAVFSGNKSQIIGNYKATSKHKANICCEFLMNILACHKSLWGNMSPLFEIFLLPKTKPVSVATVLRKLFLRAGNGNEAATFQHLILLLEGKLSQMGSSCLLSKWAATFTAYFPWVDLSGI